VLANILFMLDELYNVINLFNIMILNLRNEFIFIFCLVITPLKRCDLTSTWSLISICI
jgi:hypothetical protein